METDGLPTPDSVIFGEIQLLLAEKRPALASPRARKRALRRSGNQFKPKRLTPPSRQLRRGKQSRHHSAQN